MGAFSVIPELNLCATLPYADPFAQDYPDSVDAAIDSTAQRCRFNKTRGTWAGHLLASGCSDGLVEVVDLDTKDIIRSYDGHVKAVESLR